MCSISYTLEKKLQNVIECHKTIRALSADNTIKNALLYKTNNQNKIKDIILIQKDATGFLRSFKILLLYSKKIFKQCCEYLLIKNLFTFLQPIVCESVLLLHSSPLNQVSINEQQFQNEIPMSSFLLFSFTFLSCSKDTLEVCD